ncbi:ABATE domain-containing protein [Streptomyces alkaliterrae]|uniref:ABATE domain-containing protein n=1 Tax=Streptomyces alkaliterrae TaxID=2213162 RepID=A0A5P0YX83_9ACTN|nr:ABATE domain-containing protein [Streptomyces alkaliterrae]MBB1256122.1 ABATE domain-containing protein [Streptomyces alkaliterrae]MBB1261761.1 ABATE domain-containing protein [Streptomyces alkaliterrae]MQS04590.1 hypothetical protein [Streptomyces alkaliterrae]
MTTRSLRQMPWVGENAVLDLANTVVCETGPARRDIDLLADVELLASWRERVADRRLAALPIEELTPLRGLVRQALEAASRDAAPDEHVRAELNKRAETAPVTFLLTSDGNLEQRETGGPVDGSIARQALAVTAGPDRARVRRCHAPSCGMYFLARRRDQAWCTVGCGNRARSARRES